MHLKVSEALSHTRPDTSWKIFIPLQKNTTYFFFSETHLDQSIDSSSMVLEGFGLPIRKGRSQHGVDVMIFISYLLVYKRRTDLEDPRLEAIWIEITLKHSVLICCSYPMYRKHFIFHQCRLR